MSQKRPRDRSIAQRVANRGRERGLSRDDAFTAYAMDRLLYRLGRSTEARELWLKGGILVAAVVDTPHRFTRDIDLLRRRGPPEPADLRKRLRSVTAVSVPDDGIAFDPRVRATRTDREVDGYEGVKVLLEADVGGHDVELGIDVGFGDAVVPKPAVGSFPRSFQSTIARTSSRTPSARSWPRRSRPSWRSSRPLRTG